MNHPFTPGKRGVCIFPVFVAFTATDDGETYKACGKMRILHDESPVLVTADGRVVDGEARLRAALDLDLPVQVRVLD